MTQTQRVGVYGFILNKHQEVLIVKRSNHDSYPGIWELPGGGVDASENPEQAVKREVKEEAGLDVDVLFPFSVILHESTKEKQVFRITYLCKIVSASESVTLSPEHSEYKWVFHHADHHEFSSGFLNRLFADYQKRRSIHI